jgi:hypothetical protein
VGGGEPAVSDLKRPRPGSTLNCESGRTRVCIISRSVLRRPVSYSVPLKAGLLGNWESTLRKNHCRLRVQKE